MFSEFCSISALSCNFEFMVGGCGCCCWWAVVSQRLLCLNPTTVMVVLLLGLWLLLGCDNYVNWAPMSRKWAQTILPGLWPRLVRLGWHIIHNSATQPEVTDASPSLKQTNYSTHSWHHISSCIASSRSWRSSGNRFRIRVWICTWYKCRSNSIFFSVRTMLCCLLHSGCFLPEMSVSGDM